MSITITQISSVTRIALGDRTAFDAIKHQIWVIQKRSNYSNATRNKNYFL